jgi:hypothetical protein
MTEKILIFLRPAGDAPTLSRQKFKLDGSKSLIEVEKFLKKNLGIPADRSVYLYCGSGFSPSIDQNLQELFDNFQLSGELVIIYGINEIWG